MVSEIPIEECQERLAAEFDKLLRTDRDLTQDEEDLRQTLIYWLYAQMEKLVQFELGVR